MSPADTSPSVVASWQEPQITVANTNLRPWQILTVAALVAGLLALLGWRLAESSYYLAAGVALAAALLILSQRRAVARSRAILLTDQFLQVGNTTYSLDKLAGFWIKEEEECLVVNVELAKGSPLPLSLLYPAAKEAPLRDTLLQVLPEVEPRQKTLADSISSYIRL